MTSRIYTRTGDRGETSLFRGGRVGKANPRVEAYGTVDELNAALGVALACGLPDEVAERVMAVQRDLFELGAELATPPKARARPAGVRDDDVQILERAIDEAQASLPELRSFVLPTGTPGAAALHLARAVCRRAERRCVALRDLEPETTLVPVTYLNRLSDLLFVLARVCNDRAGCGDTEWHARPPSEL